MRKLFSSITKKLAMLPWDMVSVIVLAVNSYITLLYRNRDMFEIVYIMLFLIIAYFVTMPLLAHKLKHHARGKLIFERVNKGFRVFYTGISLTAVILNMIRTSTANTLQDFMAEQRGKIPTLLIIAIMGLSCFWMPKPLSRLIACLSKWKLLSGLSAKLKSFSKNN